MERWVERLRPLGPSIERVGYHVALYGTVAVLLMIGGLKFTAYEAEAIRPLVETSPLLSWAYAVFSPRGFSNLLGVVEIAAGLLLAVAPFAPRLGAVGGALAAATFVVTGQAGLGGEPRRLPGSVRGRRLPHQGRGPPGRRPGDGGRLPRAARRHRPAAGHGETGETSC